KSLVTSAGVPVRRARRAVQDGSSIGARARHLRNQFRNFDANERARSLTAGNLQTEVIAVQHAKALVDVADSDAIHVNLRHTLLGYARAVIFHLDDQSAVA